MNLNLPLNVNSANNKAFDLQDADSKVSELIQTSFVEELTPDDSSLKNTSNYLSRAPPKK